MEDKLLFIDTETGGLDPDEHSLLSLAMVVWDDMKITDSTEILINDGQLKVTKEALSINNINIEEHKKQAITPSEAVEKMIDFIRKNFPEKRKITVAGHNVHFDIDFLKVLLNNTGINFSHYFSHRIIDTSSILYYLYLSGSIKQKATSSDEAFLLFEIKVNGRHTALGDAIATAELFNKLISLMQKD